jgi:tetratricopeptide (TPR) repeat protein
MLLARSWRGCRVRLTTAGAIFFGLALVWTCWSGQGPLPAPLTTASSTALPAPQQPPSEAGARPGFVVSQPQDEAAGLKKSAVEVARQLAGAYPEDALTYALLGSAYYNTGQSAEAVKHLRKCLELNPGQVDAYEILARVAYEKGELEESIRLCQEALKHGPATPEVLNQWGRDLMDLGRTEEAVLTLQQAVRLPRPISQSSYLLGQAKLQSGEYAQAKENFQRAIALLPDHTQAYFGLYTACLRLGQTEEAGRYREQFQRLEAIDRRSLSERSAQEDTLTGLPAVRQTVARTFFGAAQVYRVHGQAAQAAELLRKSASLDGENAVYRTALEAHYVQRNALAEGVMVFEQLVAEQPESSLNYFFLGRLHSRLNHFEAAEQAYRKVQELAPQWPEGYRSLAELYLRADRNPAEARVLARRVVELEPSGKHYYLLAVACVKNNDRAGTEAALKQAVALSPGETKYQQLLQQLKEAP